MINILDNLYELCKEPNWDGDNALPIKLSAIEYAKLFFNKMGNYLDFCDDPCPCCNGEIHIDFFRDKNSLTISINETGKIIYAGLFDIGCIKSLGDLNVKNNEDINKIKTLLFNMQLTKFR